MISRQLQDIDASDLQALLSEQRHEGRTLDYKRDLNLASDDDRKELARDVSSLANAGGGDLIYGIEEAREGKENLGYPAAILGVECLNWDATKRRFESIISDLIDPRIQGVAFHTVEGGYPRGPAIIVRVPPSWSGPHMVSYKNQTHFYSRNSAGKHPLDVREIRAAFLAEAEFEAFVRTFRDERLTKILHNQTPIALRQAVGSEARLAVHVVPRGRGSVAVDLQKLNGGTILRPPDASSWSKRFNLDGLVAYAGPEKGGQRSYAQVFRDGSFEAVTCGFFQPATQGKRAELYAWQIETATVKAVEVAFKVLAANGYNGPASVLVTVMHVNGAWVWRENARITHLEDELHSIDRDVLNLPDAYVEQLSADPRVFLRPTFDALWQSSGWERSYGYTDDGTWDPKHGI